MYVESFNDEIISHSHTRQ